MNCRKMAFHLNPSRVVLLATGSYNPPTNMHLRIFELAKDYLQNNGQQVVGGIISPVHDCYKKKGLVSAHHRYSMVKLALQTSNWLHVSDWEINQEDWSRTATSLKFHKEALNELNPVNPPEWVAKIQQCVSDGTHNPIDIKLMLLCGADLLESFAVPGLWKNEDIENIVTNYGLLVITRSNSNPQKFIYESDLLTRLQKNISIVPEWITNEISSTKVRRALSRKESVKYLIQDSVIEYIEHHKLYSS